MNVSNPMKPFFIICLFLVALFIVGGCKGPTGEPANDTPREFKWSYANPEETGVSAEKIDILADNLLKLGTKKLLIIKNDKIICERFAPGWHDSIKTHYTASLAKALVGGMSLSAAMSDSLIQPDMPAFHFIPQWKDSYRKAMITIRHLATHTSGLEDAEASPAEAAILAKKELHRHMDLPGWKGQFWRKDPDPFSVSRDSAKVIFSPGARFQYSNPGIGMLTYAVTASLKGSPFNDVRTYLKKRIYDPIGIDENEYGIGYNTTYSVDSLELVASWGGGNFTARAIARIGRLMLRQGNWEGRQLLDSAVVRECVTYAGTALPSTESAYAGASLKKVRSADNPVPATTLGWYSNFDGVWEFLPRDAFCGSGAGNQTLLVVPSLDLIVVRMGSNLYDASKGETSWGAVENHLFNPLMDAITAPPYPDSELISEATFAPPGEVIRMAKGGDNWPMTWADNDTLYTAYGDGKGFDPKTEVKLSLGLAKVSGYPPNVKGENIRTLSGERVGDGKHGPKASGMLMVDGILYMWVRNTNNAQLASSADHGKTWLWADWRFEESFGCPNFINYGKNYAGAKDDYVYTYSVDEGTAYKYSDHMVLARVPKDKIMDRRQYEFFAGYDSDGSPLWSEDMHRRKPTFVNPGKCYRNSMSYNQGLERYLWCQILPLSGKAVKDGPRFKGGLGIFESPNPWGPWKTVYYTRQWDMGPGESGSLPTKWMSEDGKILHYVFSGDDSFSVRKMTLTTNGEGAFF